MDNRVVIVGRPNVGKSSLFNRIVGRRKTIVEDVPGVTRDAVEAKADWKGKEFVIVDTGGLLPKAEDDILRSIKETIEREIGRADIILFVVDGREGPKPLDQEIAKALYPIKEKVLLVVNKVDTPKEESSVYEFYSLGFERVFPVSAVHGRGVGDLLDEVGSRLGREKVSLKYEGIRISFVGRPNVGKSSLINAILKEERVIVSPVAGTTRDAVEIPFSWKGREFVLVDTAGVRRPSRVRYGVEFFSVGRTIRAVEDSDVVCLMIDASEGVTRQDKRLGGLIERRFRGCVIVANKMDLCAYTEAEVESFIRRELFFLDYAPVAFTVATEGWGVESVLEKSILVYEDFSRVHKTSFVNRAVAKILKEKPPPHHKGKEVKVYYAFQESSRPPTIVLITNEPEGWKESYRRFFIRRLRDLLNLRHTPVKLVLRGRD